MGRRISSKHVAYVPAAHADALGLEVVGVGEYRVVEGAENEQEITDKRVVWVDDAPDDPNDPAGHFEAFEGEPEEYVAIKPQEEG